ncbi:MAG: alpha/beta hydrolase [Candidatus Saccharibacteria bacterium]|nr:alpha/beta hydrolase [Candidatus Saccharibacteria bacterium]
MKQIVLVHGGNSYKDHATYRADLEALEMDYQRLLPKKRWSDAIIAAFPDADILLPTMPNSANAQFDEWVIWFEKMIPFFKDDVRLIGHSLGAMFLAKYLHERPLAHPVRQLHLIAGGYDNPDHDYGSFMIESATGLEQSAAEIHLYHSQDDPIVPFTELTKFQADLPTAKSHIFTDRNHFFQPTFPELQALLAKEK